MSKKNLWVGGQIVCTDGVAAWMHNSDQSPRELVNSCVRRILTGDWGDTCAEDSATNDAAVIHGGRLMGVYNIPTDIDGGVNRHGMSESAIWIIIEASRDTMTVLFPGEY